ncbi:MAG: hypothetical protein BWX66_02149 [Deltaproteobacteria bacterium ADurb.Bin058]|nr:MAG: hypothetical protein BWX66_02149 [Deltaproteobacteria bacterium ADurb.Bin058]
MVIQDIAPSVPTIANNGGLNAFRIARVTDIKDLDLNSTNPSFLVAITTCGQQEARLQWMYIGRITRNLQLASNFGRGRIAQINHIQRVNLAECNNISLIANEANRVNLLTLTKATNHSDFNQFPFLFLKDGHSAFTFLVAPPTGSLGSSHAQVFFVLVKGKLINGITQDLTRSRVPCKSVIIKGKFVDMSRNRRNFLIFSITPPVVEVIVC